MRAAAEDEEATGGQISDDTPAAAAAASAAFAESRGEAFDPFSHPRDTLSSDADDREGPPAPESVLARLALLLPSPRSSSTSGTMLLVLAADHLSPPTPPTPSDN